MIKHWTAALPTRRAIIAAMLGLMALAGGAYYGLPQGTFEAPDPVAERWVPVQPQLLENQLGLVGRIEAAKRQILVAPFDGTIRYLDVVEGQRVEQGRLLLSLDTTLLDIQLRQAQAERLKALQVVQSMHDWGRSEEVARARRAVSNAELNLRENQARLADTRRLLARGIVARMEVEALEQQARVQRLDLAASQAELRAAQARGQGESRQIAEMELANAQARYDGLSTLRRQSELRAPFVGLILYPQNNGALATPVIVQEGRHVSAGTPLLELASLERIQASARVEEADLYQFHEGMPVQISGDGFEGLTLHGKVRAIGAQALPSDTYGGGSRYEVVIAIEPLTEEQQQRVRLGMSARLQVITYRSEGGLAVPAEALRQDGEGGMYVVYRKSMSLPSRKVAVKTGNAVPQGIEVLGLEPGFLALPGRP